MTARMLAGLAATAGLAAVSLMSFTPSASARGARCTTVRWRETSGVQQRTSTPSSACSAPRSHCGGCFGHRLWPRFPAKIFRRRKR